MITISVTNQKGGEGKTTTSINLADGLARRGKKTILLDIDPQSNSSSIYTSKADEEKNMFHVFNNKAKLASIIKETKTNNLFIAPTTQRLAEMEAVSANNVDAPFILRDSMEGLTGFDFCIIDCPPSLSIFTINALVASNYVLIPLQAEKFSVDGIVGLQQTITSIKKRINPQLEIIGALITQLKQHTLLTKTIIPILTKYFKVFDSCISDGVAIGESHLARCSIYDYNKKCRQAKEYEDFVKEFLDELKK
ncbi:MAG TPA: ParA family protein [Leptospiraceae bacterium]|nr:ParA family protein [Leptospiraceae bacterium]HMW03822.1 ParA family protein [Leptospiraceae bacterium]HMX33062.1 ParA family protein [Leptospiraceae bacterium]HMY29802.1 ParA family protein [Leptospiraceae bacterium]HMZ62799.1 ParA family protein [Leptospiraceae bacterium]